MNPLVERYALLRDIQPASIEQLKYAVQNFELFLGHPATTADLTDDSLNHYLVWLARRKVAHETVKSRRSALLAIWRSEAMDGVITPPRRVRNLSPRYSTPRAWTPEQVARIIAEAEKLTGRFRGTRIERGVFAKAFLLAAYETGFRLGDLLRLRRSMIQPSGLIVLVQSKTGRPHIASVRAATIEAIDAMDRSANAGKPIFGGIISERWLARLCEAILASAGIDEGSLKWFRRSGATHVEAETPGAGWRFLGHTSPRVAVQSYLDPRQTGQKPIIPPKPGE